MNASLTEVPRRLPGSTDVVSRDHVPALEAAPRGPADRVGERVPAWHPVAIFLAGVVLSWAALASVTVLIGLAFTQWVLPLGGLDAADAQPVEWMADRRTSFLDALSFVGSEISGGFVIPALVGAVVIIAAFQRRWLLAGFVLAAIVIESASYRATVLVVERNRPDVERLDGLAAEASFPSGHVAASIAVYSGFALLLTSQIRSARTRRLVWIVALVIPLIVAVARMYRGMHHPLDTLAGVLVGIAALTLALFVARVTGVVAGRRAEVGLR